VTRSGVVSMLEEAGISPVTGALETSPLDGQR
jgi:hypothetical protein